jgi:hypothetical protein
MLLIFALQFTHPQFTRPRTTCAQLNLVVQQHWTFPDFALAMRFSPVSPHVVTIHKNGFLRIYKDADALSNEYVQALDISAKVYSLVDEGFNSFAFDPAYDGTTNKFGESQRKCRITKIRHCSACACTHIVLTLSLCCYTCTFQQGTSPMQHSQQQRLQQQMASVHGQTQMSALITHWTGATQPAAQSSVDLL